ncbi:hypothetical protein SDC9_72902 [bioreactor metagenome]|uniref:Uncharacterized protein n=1 Tax=bioreactor metagenome TaxID=1076179 RepID=A0A644YER9_9ZZZZ
MEKNMIQLKYVPVQLERFIGVGKASGLLRTPVIINPYEGSPLGAFPLSFHESERLRNDYMDTSVRGIDWGDPAGSFTVEYVVPLPDEQIEQENAGSRGDMPVVVGGKISEVINQFLIPLEDDEDNNRVSAHSKVIEHGGSMQKLRGQNYITISCIGILGFCRGYRVCRDKSGNLRIFRRKMTWKHIKNQAVEAFLNLFHGHKTDPPSTF